MSRRTFITGAAALAAALPAGGVLARPRFDSDPFSLGVASGYPRPDGAVLWTRLAPRPVEGGGMTVPGVEVAWEVAGDAGFRKIVRRGTALAERRLAHSVHAEVAGLEPARWYYYRFHAGAAVSPAGRLRTAPAAGAVTDRLRFAFASCQHYEQGYFAAYGHMARDELDLVVHLGDYIYEGSWSRDPVRRHEAGEPITLDEYRNRYARYKTDPDLQAAHAAFPWLVTWDDHEVDNDYAGAHSQDRDSQMLFLKRRAAAYQAYYEHMPLPAWARPRGADMRLYTRASFGDLVRFHVLDGRQHRDPQPCPRPGRGGGWTTDDCPDRTAPRTMLGAAQEQWLFEGLAASRARWNVIAQPTVIAQIDRAPDEGQSFHTDTWDGYPAARARLIGHLHAARVANPLTIGGDVHMSVVADLKTDFDDPRAPTVATEFVTTSISSRGPARSRTETWLAENAHLKHARGTRRGYAALDISPQRATARLRTLDDVRDPASPIRTSAMFVVEDGRPGGQRA